MYKSARRNLSSRLSTTTATVIQGRLKLARLFAMSEQEFEELAHEAEASTRFGRLETAGILSRAGFSNARFAARRFAGYGLRMSSAGLPELVDGNCDLVRLMQGIGQDKFEECFLKAEALSDAERASKCKITVEEARKLREFVDRAFIQAEFEEAVPPPEKVYSTVARIEIEKGTPILAFFHREVWKSRYRIDQDRLSGYLHSVSAGEADKVRNLLRRLDFLNQRKATLYRVLEALLKVQTKFLLTGEPAHRHPLTQRSLAAELDVDPSVLNRLVSNKSIELPWGMEAQIMILLPSAKEINRERLYVLARSNPQFTDEELRRELERLYNVRLSRRSIAQYRKELALGGYNRRGTTPSISIPISR